LVYESFTGYQETNDMKKSAKKLAEIKPLPAVAMTLFTLVAVMHLIRMILGWEVIVDGVTIPMWVSIFGFAIPGTLAFMFWREAQK
jgi:hypothetical protein